MREHADDLGGNARRLMRAADRATLSTALAEDGWPYASLVLLGCGHDAVPLALISDLAEHTRNLHSDARASLLYDGTAGLDEPLTGTRVTALGRFEKCDDGALRDRYIRRHPGARDYAAFADFNLYRMSVERVHVVAGFGAIHWLAGESVLYDAAPALIEAEPDIVAHMNEDHAEAIGLYARDLLGRAGKGWVMTGVDPEGCDLRNGGETARLGFDEPVADADAARGALVALVKKARQGGEISPS